MTTCHELIAEVRRIEMNTGMRESLANGKRKKAEYRKKWETIRALRLHLERKFDHADTNARNDTA